MIRVTFKYKTLNAHLNELMDKFQKSASPEFNDSIMNEGIQMFKQVDGDTTYILLDIYYRTVEDYEKRTEFERNNDAWNDIWFKENHHSLESIEIYECM